MNIAKLNRRAYLESTLYLQKNLKKDIKESVNKLKPLIDPLRYNSSNQDFFGLNKDFRCE